MRGLLLKDFLLIKKNVLLVVTLSTLSCIAFTITRMPGLLIPILVMLFCEIASSTISSDKISSWDRREVVFPLPIKRAVLSKYMLYTFAILIANIIGIAICLLLSAFFDFVTGKSILQFALIGILVGFGSASISIPCNYKFESDKATFVLLLSYLCIIGVMWGIGLFVNLFMPVIENIRQFSMIVAGISIIMFVISYCLTYRKVRIAK